MHPMPTFSPQSPNRPPAGHTPGCPAEGNPTTHSAAPKDSLDAHLHVIPGEDPADLEALAREYRTQFHPVGPVERFLVDTLIQCDWKKRRLTRAENQFLRVISEAFHDYSEPLGAGYEFDGAGPNILRSFFRQQAANERSYFRAITELRSQQEQRQPAKPAQPAKEASVPPEPQHHYPQTGGIGFVSQNDAPAVPLAPTEPAPPVTINLGKGHPKDGLVFVG
jgi:hypothetical protein